MAVSENPGVTSTLAFVSAWEEELQTLYESWGLGPRGARTRRQATEVQLQGSITTFTPAGYAEYCKRKGLPTAMEGIEPTLGQQIADVAAQEATADEEE